MAFEDLSPIIREDIENIIKNISEEAKKLEGKTVLVTGGAGFLGKYIVWTLERLNKRVLENPCKIIILDNFITGIKGSLEESENIKIIECNISKMPNLNEKIDFIFHAASIAAPMFYNKHRLETIDVGILGTKNILELAVKNNVESFLFFSTSEIYGNPDPKFIPTPETYFGNVSCTGPRAAYDEPKRIGETLCVTYADVYNLPVKIVRPFNVYGPGMRLDDGRGAINFAVSALKGEKIPVYGHGRNTRTWCYITDAIVGFFQIILSDHNKEAFNIGSDEQEIQMKHFADIVSGLVARENVEVHNIEGPNDVYGKADVNRRCPDLSKSRTVLGYTPKMNLISGLKRFISWVDEELERQSKISGIQESCRVCGNSNLKPVISLGESPLANNLLSVNDLDKNERKYPLEMVYCDHCHLCQLSYIVPPEEMFSNYLYVTSTTQSFRDHFKNFAENITTRFNLNERSLVVDIGSNDGLLLKGFRDKGVRVVGVEPARNIANIAIKDGVDTLAEFFNEDVVNRIKEMKGQADIITANNVFAHIADIKSVVSNVKKLMNPLGVYIIEVQHILETIRKLTFDNIYHEHLYYYSLIALKNFFEMNGMEVFDVEKVNTHGGSIRVYVQNKGAGREVNSRVTELIEEEVSAGLKDYTTYKEFARKINDVRNRVREFITSEKNNGKKFAGYGAPAKATTMLNFYNLTNDEIDFIVDDNPLKQNLIVPGVRIPIKGKKHLEENKPDHLIILAWNFAEEIIRNNKDILDSRTRFLVPTPELRII